MSLWSPHAGDLPARRPRAAGQGRLHGNDGETRAGRRERAYRRAQLRNPSHRNDWRLALLLIAPAVVGFAVFAVYPTLRGVYLSFTDFRVLSPPEWTGLDNIRTLFDDDMFWHSLRVTLYFVVLSVVFGLAVSLFTAVVLHRLTKSTVIRGLVILPFLISGCRRGARVAVDARPAARDRQRPDREDHRRADQVPRLAGVGDPVASR